MSEGKQAVYKFTLSTKKEVTLREPKIGHSRTAAQIAGKIAGNNMAHLQMCIQEEMIKLLLVEVDGKTVPRETGSLDSYFSVAEYTQVIKAVDMISGGDSQGEPVMSIDVSGN